MNQEILGLLREMRKLLVPISGCFEEQYSEIRIRRERQEFEEFQEFLGRSAVRPRLYPLLFDSRGLTQDDMANEAGTSQSTVSAFIISLLKQGWIEKDDTGELPYRERFPFREMLEAESGNE